LNASRAIQCFYQAGTYGAVTVTTTGACGSELTYGGITGTHIGNGGVDESCTFNFSPAIVGTSATVAFTAHTCNTVGCEKVGFHLNGADYIVQTGDLDDSTPSGGDEPSGLLPSGEVEGAPNGGEGRATVTFNNAPTSLSSIEIVHTHTVADGGGTVYLICLDDTPVPVEIMRFTIE